MNECKPDAVVCKMDHYAALVGRHLMGMGLTIGKDILLAGFDDDPLAGLLPVPLTTIRFVADPFAKTLLRSADGADRRSVGTPAGG